MHFDKVLEYNLVTSFKTAELFSRKSKFDFWFFSKIFGQKKIHNYHRQKQIIIDPRVMVFLLCTVRLPKNQYSKSYKIHRIA